MSKWLPSSRTLAVVFVVALFLGVLGSIWIGSSPGGAPRGSAGDGNLQAPSRQLGGGPVGQGGPLPESPAVSFDPPTVDGVAGVDGREFDSLARAVSAAQPGDTVRAKGRFYERVRIETPNLTVESPRGSWGVIDGSQDGVSVDVRASNVTLRGLWVHGAARNGTGPDLAIKVQARDVSIERTRLTNVGFGVRGERADGLRIANVTIVGHPDPADGIRLWRTENPIVTDSRFTRLRDAIRYEWVTDGRTFANDIWDVRYGFSILYSSSHRVQHNRFFNSDVGVLLLHATGLRVSENWIVNNTGRSGHGVVLNSVDDGRFENNTILSNGDGFYIGTAVGNRFVGNNISFNGKGVVFSAEQNELARNVIAHNRVGVILVKPVAESVLERVSQENTFDGNGQPIYRTDW